MIPFPSVYEYALTDLCCAACRAPLIPRIRGAQWHCDACDAAICPACGATVAHEDFLCAACRQAVDGRREQEHRDARETSYS